VRWQAACDAAEAATRWTEDVPRPQALIATEEDARVWPFKVGEPIWEGHIELLDGLRILATGNSREGNDPQVRATRDARSRELTATLKQWKEECQQATVRSGELDAWNHADGLLAEEQKLWAQITATPARTVAGMMAKLALVAPCCEGLEPEDKGSSEDLLFSVAHDFNSLQPALATV
jgi:hypothetical protein